ncbi:MAG: polysaccharide biosynthesis/export family protein, partial [Lacunisphaera sp.]
HRFAQTMSGVLCVILLGLFTGCETPPPPSPMTAANSQPEVLTIREGDVLKISFPGAPTLDTQQQVRRDGRITMPLGGEVVAAGLTPNGLEQDLLKVYAAQLVSKEVSVTVVSSTFTVFVSGAVVRPGKIVSDHPLTALEAVMEAGGFDRTKADMRAVVVTRQDASQYKNYTVDLKSVLDGKQTEPFYLKPADVVYVPELFSWF